MSSKTLQLSDGLYQYMLKVSMREPELLRRLREETARMPRAGMQISPEQGQFMSFLVQLMGVRQALEIGVFTGYSSLCTGLALPDDGRIVACDLNSEWTSVAQRYWREAGVDHKIDLRLAPAVDTLEALLTDGRHGTFDFVFIDADKQNYLNYYTLALDLVRRGGVIAIDNVLWGGSVCDPAASDPDTLAIRELNETLHEDARIALSMVPIGDGLTLAMKR